MSLVNRFSVSYSMEKAKRRSQNLNQTNKIQINPEVPKVLTDDLAEALMKFGFDIDQIVIAFKVYKFTTVDEGIITMMKDPETDKYNHKFLNSFNSEGYVRIPFNSDKCLICGDIPQSHIDNEHHTTFKDDTRDVSKINTPRISIEKVNIPKETLDQFDDPDICRICFAEKIGISNKALFSCEHVFCRNCVFSYLTNNINSGKVRKINSRL
jgi:hypothetical protein